jgi:hypothetical protein
LTLPAQLASIAGMSSAVQSNEKDASIQRPPTEIPINLGDLEFMP